jgi:RNA polymerase sigma factor (sigma-70 family)
MGATKISLAQHKVDFIQNNGYNKHKLTNKTVKHSMSEKIDPWKTSYTLLEKLRDKYDSDSWENFAHHYKPYIYNVIRRMNISHSFTEDFSQIILLKLWDKLPETKIDPEKGTFRSWLTRVIKNEILNYLNKEKRRQDKLTEKYEEQLKPYLDGSCNSDIERLANEEWAAYIAKKAWKNIESQYEEVTKQCFRLASEGSSADQIAAQLGISEAVVYVYKARIKNKLKQEIRRLHVELQ